MGNPAGPRKAYCTSCGELVDADDRFCAYCGTELAHRERRANECSQRQERYSSTRRSQDEYSPRRHRRRQRRQTPDSPLRAVGVAVGLAVTGMLSLTLVAVIGTLFGVLLRLPVVVALAIAATVAHFLGFVGVAWVYLRHRGYDSEQQRSYIGLRRPTVRQLGLVVAGNLVIVVLLAVLFGLVEMFSLLPADEGTESVQDELADLGVGAGVYLVLVVFMLAVVGPTEEVLYRGVIQNRLREQFSVVPAIAIASAVFTAIHLQIFLVGSGILGVAVGFLALFIPSIVLGVVYEYTENIAVPSLVHGIHNSLIVTVLFFGPSFLADYITF